MLMKRCDATDISICREHLVCEECPCYVKKSCVHPYSDEPVKAGDLVKPSIFNTDTRVKSENEYIVKSVSEEMGVVEIILDDEETDWYSEDDFIIVERK